MAVDATKLTRVGYGEGYTVYMYYTNDTDATIVTDGYFDAVYPSVRLHVGDIIIAAVDMDGTPYPYTYIVTVDGGDGDITVARGPTSKGVISIPMPTITDAGVALAAFSDGDSATPGFCVTAEGLGIRWNNHATPTPVGTKVIVPPDIDITANVVLNILAAKVGATAGDAVKFTVQAFNNDVAALYDADADFGGDSSAMTGDADTKTVQHVTLTLALANLTAYPAAVELTLQPKDGTLGTDDVIMLAQWLEYTKL